MLFKTIGEIKAFLPVGAGNQFDRLKPHIENAENKFVKPLLGTAMYEELQEFYDTPYPELPTEVQEVTKELLTKVQHSVIHLAYFIGFDFLNINVSDTGFQRLESERTKGLFKYQENNLKKYFSEAGFNGLDDVLVFLEQNIEHFGEFKMAPNWTELKKSFLPTVKVVEEIPFNLHSSRLIFLAMRPAVTFIEDTEIQKTLGTAIYDEVKAEMAKDAPDEKVEKLLPYIRKPLIYLASALFMEETGAELGEKGLLFEAIAPNSTGQNTRRSEPSAEERILAMVARNRYIGNSYLDMLRSYLKENWEEYDGDVQRRFNRDNTGKRTFWA